MNKSAPRLDQASDALAGALARLEEKIEHVTSKAATQKQAEKARHEMQGHFQQEINDLQEENLQLRENNAKLERQLEDLQEAYSQMQQRNERIAGQIDRQVEQLELMA